jgi:glycosyltransferase involved in cell wall biosynthesis
LVWGIRGLGDPFPGLLSRLEQQTSFGVPLVIANSTASERFHRRRGLRPKRWEVIHNGFDVDRFRPRPEFRMRVRATLGLSPRDFVVGCVARFTPEKDHGTLLRAIRYVYESRPDTVVVLVRAGSHLVSARIRACARAFDLADRLVVVEAREGVEEYYAAFDVHALASWSESFPNAIGEAMASGCPVVATDVGGVRELVGEAGVLVPPRDERALAQAIGELASNPARRVALAAAGRERVVQTFSVDRLAELTRSAWRRATRPLLPRRGSDD